MSKCCARSARRTSDDTIKEKLLSRAGKKVKKKVKIHNEPHENHEMVCEKIDDVSQDELTNVLTVEALAFHEKMLESKLKLQPNINFSDIKITINTDNLIDKQESDNNLEEVKKMLVSTSIGIQESLTLGLNEGTTVKPQSPSVETQTKPSTSFEKRKSIASEDDLIKLKLRSNMSDSSVTQYFALKSEFNLDAFQQDMKARRDKYQAALARDSGIVNRSPGVSHLNTQKVFEVPDSSQSATTIVKTASMHSVKFREPITIQSTSKRTCKKCHVQEDTGIELTMKSGIENMAVMEDITEETTIETDTICDVDDDGDDGSLVEMDKFKGLKMSMTSFRGIPGDPLTQTFHFSLISFITTEDLIREINAIKESNETEEQEIFLQLKWNFLQYQDNYEFPMVPLPELLLDFNKKYYFEINQDIYQFLYKCAMHIELFVRCGDETKILGKCSLKLAKAIESLNATLETKLLMNNADLCLCYPTLVPATYGYLTCRYVIKGELEFFERFKCEKPPMVEIPPLGDGSYEALFEAHNTSQRKSQSLDLVDISPSELNAFNEGLNLVLVRNKALRTTQTEISAELKERTTWMHEELKWRLTLQENAILSGKDPNNVKWRQWKDETTAKVKYRPLTDETPLDTNALITITIIDLYMYPDSRPMVDDTITQIYMEYGFLTYFGPSMETVCKKKPEDDQAIVYNFGKQFNIQRDSKEAKLLADIIKNSEPIQFTAVSQPIEDPIDLQSCTDIGSAYINLYELLHNRGDVVVDSYPMIDEYNNKTQIGLLKVKFQGILSMRSLALNMLTPKHFKILR